MEILDKLNLASTEVKIKGKGSIVLPEVAEDNVNYVVGVDSEGKANVDLSQYLRSDKESAYCNIEVLSRNYYGGLKIISGNSAGYWTEEFSAEFFENDIVASLCLTGVHTFEGYRSKAVYTGDGIEFRGYNEQSAELRFVNREFYDWGTPSRGIFVLPDLGANDTQAFIATSKDLESYITCTELGTTLLEYAKTEDIPDSYTKAESDDNYLKLRNLGDSQVNVGFSNHKGVKFTFLSNITSANVGFGAPEETEIDNGRIFEVRASNALGYDNSIKFDPLNSAIIKKVSIDNANSVITPEIPTPPDVQIEIEYALSIPSKTGIIATLDDIPDVSSFISKDISNLTNYETKTTAEGKYAQKSTTLSGYGVTDAYTKTETYTRAEVNAIVENAVKEAIGESMTIPLSEFDVEQGSLSFVDGESVNNSDFNVYYKKIIKNETSTTVDVLSEFPSVELFKEDSSSVLMGALGSSSVLNKRVLANIFFTDILENETEAERYSTLVIVINNSVDINNVIVHIKGIKYKTVSINNPGTGQQ